MVASFTERIKIVIDVAAEKGTSAIKDFRTSIAEAEGATGKFKAGIASIGSSLGTLIKSPAGIAAAATAASTAVAKLVTQASELGLAVGKLADSTGLNVEEASRWLEVTGDIGISSEALAGSLKKMEQAINPERFAELGVEITRTNTGAVDVSATFLNVIDRLHKIEDPALRAQTAAKLLGKSWQDMSELIAMGAPTVAAKLAEVSDAKIIDQQGVQDAREFRDQLDNLKDIAEDAALSIGRELLPAVTGLVQAAGYASRAVGLLKDGLDNLLPSGVDGDVKRFAQNTYDAFSRTDLARRKNIKSAQDLERQLRLENITQEEVTSAVNDNAKSQSAAMRIYQEATRGKIDWITTGQAAADAADREAAKQDMLARAAKEAALAIDRERTANDNLINGLNDSLAGLNLYSLFDELPGRLAKLKQDYDKGEITARQYWIGTATEIETAKAKLADYLLTVKGIPANVATTFVADVTGAEGEIDRIIAKADKYLTDQRISLERGGVGAGLATGGYASGITMVGENGPELVDLPGGSTVYNRVATSRLLGSINQPVAAVTSPVTVNVMSADPQAVVAAIKKYRQRGGQL